MNEPRERTSIEHPIATRELHVRDPDGDMRDVEILIAAPEPVEGAEDYVCLYQIVGIGTGRIGTAYGVDSAQALILALRAIGIELAAHRQRHGLEIWWLSEGDEELGFPLPVG